MKFLEAHPRTTITFGFLAGLKVGKTAFAFLTHGKLTQKQREETARGEPNKTRRRKVFSALAPSFVAAKLLGEATLSVQR